MADMSTGRTDVTRAVYLCTRARRSFNVPRYEHWREYTYDLH